VPGRAARARCSSPTRYFRERGIRDRVELVYVTPLDGAFTKPVAAARLGHLLEPRGIVVETDFMVERIDPDAKRCVSYDEREVPFDLLVTVPLNMGADFLAGSGLGRPAQLREVDKHTLQSRYPNVFALGDAADLPTSKAAPPPTTRSTSSSRTSSSTPAAAR
jgi:sulfide:quinone oxidoreductase